MLDMLKPVHLADKCLAIVLNCVDASASCDSGVEVLKDFQERNHDSRWNAAIAEAVRGLEYVGWVKPGTLFVTGPDVYLECLRGSWARHMLKPPGGFVIKCVGDVDNIEMKEVPRSHFMSLPETLCAAVAFLNQQGQIASLDAILELMKSHYVGMNIPRRGFVQDTLERLVSESQLCSTGKGYLVSPILYAQYPFGGGGMMGQGGLGNLFGGHHPSFVSPYSSNLFMSPIGGGFLRGAPPGSFNPLGNPTPNMFSGSGGGCCGGTGVDCYGSSTAFHGYKRHSKPSPLILLNKDADTARSTNESCSRECQTGASVVGEPSSATTTSIDAVGHATCRSAKSTTSATSAAAAAGRLSGGNIPVGKCCRAAEAVSTVDSHPPHGTLDGLARVAVAEGGAVPKTDLLLPTSSKCAAKKQTLFSKLFKRKTVKPKEGGKPDVDPTAPVMSKSCTQSSNAAGDTHGSSRGVAKSSKSMHALTSKNETNQNADQALPRVSDAGNPSVECSNPVAARATFSAQFPPTEWMFNPASIPGGLVPTPAANSLASTALPDFQPVCSSRGSSNNNNKENIRRTSSCQNNAKGPVPIDGAEASAIKSNYNQSSSNSRRQAAPQAQMSKCDPISERPFINLRDMKDNALRGSLENRLDYNFLPPLCAEPALLSSRSGGRSHRSGRRSAHSNHKHNHNNYNCNDMLLSNNFNYYNSHNNNNNNYEHHYKSSHRLGGGMLNKYLSSSSECLFGLDTRPVSTSRGDKWRYHMKSSRENYRRAKLDHDLAMGGERYHERETNLAALIDLEKLPVTGPVMDDEFVRPPVPPLPPLKLQLPDGRFTCKNNGCPQQHQPDTPLKSNHNNNINYNQRPHENQLVTEFEERAFHCQDAEDWSTGALADAAGHQDANQNDGEIPRKSPKKSANITGRTKEQAKRRRSQPCAPPSSRAPIASPVDTDVGVSSDPGRRTSTPSDPLGSLDPEDYFRPRTPAPRFPPTILPPGIPDEPSQCNPFDLQLLNQNNCDCDRLNVICPCKVHIHKSSNQQRQNKDCPHCPVNQTPQPIGVPMSVHDDSSILEAIDLGEVVLDRAHRGLIENKNLEQAVISTNPNEPRGDVAVDDWRAGTGDSALSESPVFNNPGQSTPYPVGFPAESGEADAGFDGSDENNRFSSWSGSEGKQADKVDRVAENGGISAGGNVDHTYINVGRERTKLREGGSGGCEGGRRGAGDVGGSGRDCDPGYDENGGIPSLSLFRNEVNFTNFTNGNDANSVSMIRDPLNHTYANLGEEKLGPGLFESTRFENITDYVGEGFSERPLERVCADISEIESYKVSPV